jgi:inorganic pyrophosphatase
VKYELDKRTGYLRVDRPQRTSSQPPALYGLVPRTYCGRRVQALSPTSKRGDKDPLDICVISERRIDKNELMLDARVVGGLQMVDGEEADDKILAVLANDWVWSGVNEFSELPDVLVERLMHYFSTYKLMPGEPSHVSIESVYGVEHAAKVIQASMADYDEEFGE